jgi:hypothetical protein
MTSAYLHRIGENNPRYGQSLYLGLSLTAADMSGRIDTQHTDPIYSGAIGFGGRTPLGPLTISLGLATTSDWRIVLALGRPVEERNVSDPVW